MSGEQFNAACECRMIHQEPSSQYHLLLFLSLWERLGAGARHTGGFSAPQAQHTAESLRLSVRGYFLIMRLRLRIGSEASRELFPRLLRRLRRGRKAFSAIAKGARMCSFLLTFRHHPHYSLRHIQSVLRQQVPPPDGAC